MNGGESLFNNVSNFVNNAHCKHGLVFDFFSNTHQTIAKTFYRVKGFCPHSSFSIKPGPQWQW